MSDSSEQTSRSDAASNPATCPTRVPRTAQARLLLHDAEVDAPFMAVLNEALPDEAARLAYLNHLGWQART
ncbi:MAG: hypothetical protein WAU60_14450 [Candidatus Competibacter denitrificans]|jgi:hypothetical protein|uniref:Uncharacterized protein n=1 Tax=Candidatus Competibacter denitrificans Run_A_D11 TaxID=1400863 RepID=W6MBP2_9GAMM|nr:hypothetical protein [Candidatus Competibacter denitrificans]CDI01433.1 hypothetical protein BN873_150221 [Candidatus Competibacter denitrificans Run_A_D11]HRC70218.1 hypothetical protein [Candidatus Competibacter denitrificans]